MCIRDSYKKRLETGDANVLETNKINLELLNVRTEFRTNQTALDNAWKSLLALNLSLIHIWRRQRWGNV